MKQIFKDVFQNEAGKLTNQFAQTALDVRGLQNMVLTMDAHLNATSEVAASTSDYLDRVAADYSRPENVDYENVVTPTSTPAKIEQQTIKDKTGSPLLGVAGTEC